MEHSAGRAEALAVGDARLVASVVAGGAATELGPVVMALTVGCSKVFTAPFPEPAFTWLALGPVGIMTTDATTAQPLIAMSKLVLMRCYLSHRATLRGHREWCRQPREWPLINH